MNTAFSNKTSSHFFVYFVKGMIMRGYSNQRFDFTDNL